MENWSILVFLDCRSHVRYIFSWTIDKWIILHVILGQYGISPIEYKHFQSNSMLTAIDMIQLWDKCYEDLIMDSAVLWSVSMFLIYESLKKASNEYNQHIVTCMRRSRTFCRAGIPLFWPANYFTRALFRHGGHCLSPRWHCHCHTDIGPECGISRHCVTSLTACMHILPRYEQCGRCDICQQVYTSRLWNNGNQPLIALGNILNFTQTEKLFTLALLDKCHFWKSGKSDLAKNSALQCGDFGDSCALVLVFALGEAEKLPATSPGMEKWDFVYCLTWNLMLAFLRFILSTVSCDRGRSLVNTVPKQAI